MRGVWLLGLGFLLGLFVACAHLVIDTSMQAFAAGDYTLAMSACEAVPAGGMDICRVRENAAIDSSWTLILPKPNTVLGWEVDVYYRDVAHAVHYVGTGPTVQIPWKDFFNQNVWTADLDGEALALVTVRYKDQTGVEYQTRLKGIAKIVVLKEGYDRLPVDSGFVAWKTACKVQYSTAGRGVVSCQ